MYSDLELKNVFLADKRNKRILLKLFEAVSKGASGSDLIEIVNNSKTSSKKLPLDMARVAQEVQTNLDSIQKISDDLLVEAKALLLIGNSIGAYLSNIVSKNGEYEDEHTKISWVQCNKLQIEKIKQRKNQTKKDK